MSGWTARVFWSDVGVVPAEGGYEVRLDGRPVRTPGKKPLVLPSRALAERVANEWRAQEDTVKPHSMPATRMANSAIEKVAPQIEEVANVIAAYGETDLLCHRAEGPEALCARQAAAWDPLLDWAAETLDARLVPVVGVMPAEQDAAALARLRAEVARLTAFELAAVHDLVALSGSLIIGLAAARGVQPADALWAASRIDEDWQIELWGEDEEASSANTLKFLAFSDALAFFMDCR